MRRHETVPELILLEYSKGEAGTKVKGVVESLTDCYGTLDDLCFNKKHVVKNIRALSPDRS